jgi:phi LC3 family holin
MKKINWKTRIKHPAFWIGIASVIATPILAYRGANPADITSWDALGRMIVDTVKNPYLLACVGTAALSFLGINTDPTTKGLGDSEQALTYEAPKEDTNEQRF